MQQKGEVVTCYEISLQAALPFGVNKLRTKLQFNSLILWSSCEVLRGKPLHQHQGWEASSGLWKAVKCHGHSVCSVTKKIDSTKTSVVREVWYCQLGSCFLLFAQACLSSNIRKKHCALARDAPKWLVFHYSRLEIAIPLSAVKSTVQCIKIWIRNFSFPHNPSCTPTLLTPPVLSHPHHAPQQDASKAGNWQGAQCGSEEGWAGPTFRDDWVTSEQSPWAYPVPKGTLLPSGCLSTWSVVTKHIGTGLAQIHPGSLRQAECTGTSQLKPHRSITECTVTNLRELKCFTALFPFLPRHKAAQGCCCKQICSYSKAGNHQHAAQRVSCAMQLLQQVAWFAFQSSAFPPNTLVSLICSKAHTYNNTTFKRGRWQ